MMVGPKYTSYSQANAQGYACKRGDLQIVLHCMPETVMRWVLIIAKFCLQYNTGCFFFLLSHFTSSHDLICETRRV